MGLMAVKKYEKHTYIQGRIRTHAEVETKTRVDRMATHQKIGERVVEAVSQIQPVHLTPTTVATPLHL